MKVPVDLASAKWLFVALLLLAFATFVCLYKPIPENLRVVPVPENARVAPVPENPRVAWVTVATRWNYFQMAENIASGLTKHFCDGKASLIVLTDAIDVPKFANLSCYRNGNATQCGPHYLVHWENYPWPKSSMSRFQGMLAYWELLSQFDYIYWTDADVAIVGDFCEDIFGLRVGMLHMHHVQRGPTIPYESNPASSAFVPESEKQLNSYYTAHLYGGRRDEFKRLIATCNEATEADYKNNIIARVWDESHLNHYFVYNPPTVLLNLAFTCFSAKALEEGNMNAESKLVAPRHKTCYIEALLKDASVRYQPDVKTLG